MALEPFRFIHATGLHLDQPLLAAGGLSGEDRHLVEDATLRAFGNLIDTCLSEQVEFLLLTGDAFDAPTKSLRARRALETGLARLSEHKIPVIIMPGSIDPPAAWRKLKLPSQATVFLGEDDEPVRLTRDGKPLAVIYSVANAQFDDSHRRAPSFTRKKNGFRIGLVGAGTAVQFDGNTPRPLAEPKSPTGPAAAVQAAIAAELDYLALGSGERGQLKFKEGIGHCPGDLQPRSPESTGPSGFSLVDVRSEGSCQCRLIPAAPVRYENVNVEVGPDLSFDGLVEKMSLSLLEHEALPSEELWLVRWTLRGCGELFNSLADRKRQDELFEFVDHELGSTGGPRRRHQLNRVPQAISVSDDIDDGPHQLLLDFLEQIDVGLMPAIETLRDDAATANWPQAPWARHVKLAVQRMKVQNVAEQARIVGLGVLS